MTRPMLITGATGQLGHALAAQAAARGLPHRAVGRPDFDLEKIETIEETMGRIRPWLVINAAAWTAVDAAEDHPAAVQQANDYAPARLALICRDAPTPLPMIHISTDYVFDGTKGVPYVETDPVAPLGVYGRTKARGENSVLQFCPQSIVLRTSWLFSAHGRNFARTMIDAGRKTDTLKVVDDQIGTPTAAEDLAEAIIAIAALIHEDGFQPEQHGIFHATNSGATSWHGFARTIFDAAAEHGERRPTILPISTADWPTKVQRPADSRLDCGKLERVFGIRLPDWRDATRRVVAAMLEAEPKPAPTVAS